jgi:hypothetical protein
MTGRAATQIQQGTGRMGPEKLPYRRDLEGSLFVTPVGVDLEILAAEALLEPGTAHALLLAAGTTDERRRF